MRRKKLIIILIALLAISSPFIAYGAYRAIRNIIIDSTSGKIVLHSKNYIIHDIDDPNTETDESLNTIYEGNTLVNNAFFSINNGTINCYATKKIGSGVEEANFAQLNQLEFEFSFTNAIDVYVRIRIEDSWLSTKIYKNGTVRTQVILKDNVALNKALEGTNWVYDSQTGYIYCREVTRKSDGETTLNIRFNPEYIYKTDIASAFVETITVSLSYEVDIVQANRANAKWNIDIDDILGE